MVTPEPTAIKSHHHKKLLDLDLQIQSIQKMMQMFQSNCQTRLAETTNEARKVWAEIAEDTQIDLKNISWEPHPTQSVVVPTSMKLIR